MTVSLSYVLRPSSPLYPPTHPPTLFPYTQIQQLLALGEPAKSGGGGGGGGGGGFFLSRKWESVFKREYEKAVKALEGGRVGGTIALETLLDPKGKGGMEEEEKEKDEIEEKEEKEGGGEGKKEEKEKEKEAPPPPPPPPTKLSRSRDNELLVRPSSHPPNHPPTHIQPTAPHLNRLLLNHPPTHPPTHSLHRTPTSTVASPAPTTASVTQVATPMEEEGRATVFSPKKGGPPSFPSTRKPFPSYPYVPPTHPPTHPLTHACQTASFSTHPIYPLTHKLHSPSSYSTIHPPTHPPIHPTQSTEPCPDCKEEKTRASESNKHKKEERDQVTHPPTHPPTHTPTHPPSLPPSLINQSITPFSSTNPPTHPPTHSPRPSTARNSRRSSPNTRHPYPPTHLPTHRLHPPTHPPTHSSRPSTARSSRSSPNARRLTPPPSDEN